MPDLLTIAFIGLAALGLGLFWRGWRGRRIDNHPWCRKCRFDLFGAAAGSTRCPECGANLDDAKAVRVGRRRRRPVMIACGSLLIAVGAAWLGLLASGALAKINWNQYKPTWWLAIEAQSTDPSTLPPILDELIARLDRGELSEARIRALVTGALDSLGPTPAAWPIEWDNFAQRAWTLDRLDEETKVRYAQNIFSPAILIQPATLDEQPAALLAFAEAPARRTKGQLSYRYALTELRYDGRTVPIPEPDDFGRIISGSRECLLPPVIVRGDSEDERLDVTIEWRFSASYGKRDSGSPRSERAVWRSTHSFTNGDLSPARATIALVTDDESRRQLMASLSVKFCAIRGTDSTPTRAAGMLSYNNPPLNARAMMTLRAGDRVISQGGDVNIQASSSGGGAKIFTLELPDESVTALDMVLDPYWFSNPAESRRRRGADDNPRTWYGQVIIPDRPVQWFDDVNDERIPLSIRGMLTHQR